MSGFAVLIATTCRVDGGHADLERHLADHQLGILIAQHVLQADEVIFAEVVVLIEDADGLARIILQDVGRIDPRFRAVARLQPDGPGKMLGIAPARGARADEQLRDLFLIEVFLDPDIARGAERREHQEDFIALDELADLLDRLRRRVRIVVGDEIDLAAVDATLIVDHPEEGGVGFSDDRVNRGRTAIGHRVADLDLGIGDADVVLLLGQCRSCGQNSSQCNRCKHNLGAGRHRVLPWLDGSFLLVLSCSDAFVAARAQLRACGAGSSLGAKKGGSPPPLVRCD